MAVKTLRISDRSGTEITDDNGDTVVFEFRGTRYEIDLTNEEIKEFTDDINSWIEDAREAPVTVSIVERRTRRATTTGENRNSPQENADIRAWVAEVGIPNVGDRGRIAADVREAFKAGKNMALLEPNHKPGAAEDGSAHADQDDGDQENTLSDVEPDENGDVAVPGLDVKVPFKQADAKPKPKTRARGKV